MIFCFESIMTSLTREWNKATKKCLQSSTDSCLEVTSPSQVFCFSSLFPLLLSNPLCSYFSFSACFPFKPSVSYACQQNSAKKKHNVKAESYCFCVDFLRYSLSSTGTFALTDPEKRHLACSLPSRVSGRNSYGVIIHVLYGKMIVVVQSSFKKYGTDIKCGWSKMVLRKERDRSWGKSQQLLRNESSEGLTQEVRMGVWGTVCRPGRAEEAQGRCGKQGDTCLPAGGRRQRW